jgi:hypothetical protein
MSTSYDRWLDPPDEVEIRGEATLHVERPVPLVGDPSDGWVELAVDADVDCSDVVGACLHGTRTPIALTPNEIENAIMQCVESAIAAEDAAREDAAERAREARWDV